MTADTTRRYAHVRIPGLACTADEHKGSPTNKPCSTGIRYAITDDPEYDRRRWSGDASCSQHLHVFNAVRVHP